MNQIYSITEKIRNWPSDDPHGLMDFVEMHWVGESNLREEDNYKWYKFITNGKEINEEIIMALVDNFLFFTNYWYLTQKGGVYVFHIPVDNISRG